MVKTRRSIGMILLQWGLITDEQLDQALAIAAGSEKRLGETLVKLGFIQEPDVTKALASQFNLPYVDLDQPNVVCKNATALISEEIIRKYMVLPIGEEDGKLQIAIHDPMDLELLDTLRFCLNRDLETQNPRRPDRTQRDRKDRSGRRHHRRRRRCAKFRSWAGRTTSLRLTP